MLADELCLTGVRPLVLERQPRLQEGIVKLSEVGAVANHISLMRHI